jgi:multicomponent Na+:H+ antiporter subunit B
MIERYLDIAVLVLVFSIAVMIVRSKNLFTVVIMGSIFSIFCALIYLIMGAPDVALTEAAVGACATTCILLASLKHFKEDTSLSKWRVISLIVFITLFVVLSYFTISIHPYGSVDAITNKGVVEYYKQTSGNEIGLLSLVNAILASYRGFDTFGETVVIFAAGLCIILILGTKNKINNEK